MQLSDKILAWLLKGDVSVVYQVKRDLLDSKPEELAVLQSRVEEEGWGKRFLNARRSDGHWGRGFYQPKWTSTHYTLLDLKALGISPANKACRDSVSMILENTIGYDGGVNYARTVKDSDVCINGMVLDLACYFALEEYLLTTIIDFLLQARLPGGGWNCLHLQEAVHFSVHTTISVLEGLTTFLKAGYSYRVSEVKAAIASGQEYILSHKLYQSHRTGQPMDPKMTMLSFPSRWRFDILRGLDYFRFAGYLYDSRMDDAIKILLVKQRKDGTWPLQAKHPGQVHFDMEQIGKPSRWNTLRALRVLNHFKI